MMLTLRTLPGVHVQLNYKYIIMNYNQLKIVRGRVSVVTKTPCEPKCVTTNHVIMFSLVTGQMCLGWEQQM